MQLNFTPYTTERSWLIDLRKFNTAAADDANETPVFVRKGADNAALQFHMSPADFNAIVARKHELLSALKAGLKLGKVKCSWWTKWKLYWISKRLVDVSSSSSSSPVVGVVVALASAVAVAALTTWFMTPLAQRANNAAGKAGSAKTAEVASQ